MTARHAGEAAEAAEAVRMLASDDQARPAIRRAVFATLQAGVVFSLLTGPVKQVAVLYDHAPWLNDPYDVVVSFAMFLVPLATACVLVRMPLLRRSEPLPLARARDVLNGGKVVLAAAGLTVLSEWSAVAAGANRVQWNWATWLQIGLLGLLTALSARAVVRMRLIPMLPRLTMADARSAPDWLGDVVAVARHYSHRLGPLDGPVARVLAFADRHLLTVVRRHPVWAACATATAFAVAVGGRQASTEGYIPLAAALTIVLLACGMFAFLVTAGPYIGLIRSSGALAGARRHALTSGVVACGGVLVALAFRNLLWWVVGSRAAVAGIGQLYELLGLTALGCFAVALAILRVRGH